MHPALVAALAPVLADLSATCRVTLRIEDEQWSFALGPSAMAWTPEPARVSNTAVWRCPQSGSVVADLGALPAE